MRVSGYSLILLECDHILQRTEIAGRLGIYFWKVTLCENFINVSFKTVLTERAFFPNFSLNQPRTSTGRKREVEDRIIPRSADADDADAVVKSDDDRLVTIYICMSLCSNLIVNLMVC